MSTTIQVNRRILITAVFLGFLSVVLGAFASHGLKNIISENSVKVFEIGVRYQVYHALFLLVLGVIPSNLITAKGKKVVWILTILGWLLFSGSIYGLATNSVTDFFDFKKIGFVTPIGGLLLMAAWLVLGILLIRQKNTNSVGQ